MVGALAGSCRSDFFFTGIISMCGSEDAAAEVSFAVAIMLLLLG